MTPYYEDESVTLYHGDCRDLHGSTGGIGAVVTDPPYGVQYANWNGEKVTGDQDFAVAEAAAEQWSPRAPWILFANHQSLPATIGLVARSHPCTRVGVWHKTNALTGGTFGNPWMADVEFFVVGTATLPKQHLSAVASGPRFVGNPNWQTRSDGFLHPTQKPTGVMEHVIAPFIDEVILDPFAGSGSTLVAAKNLGGRAIGVEVDERYCEIAARRLTQDVLDFTGGVA